MDSDYLLARQLQYELDAELSKASSSTDKGSASSSAMVKSKTRPANHEETMTIVDPQWELIDPTPDIFALFAVFNERFFWGKLHAVEVRWSPKMTSCAGVCVYQSRAGFCSVRLSRPLLIFRPRKDLVETLLHEMIHAFLFVTHNNRDRDGHGPEFHNHMNRINREAGTKITVYHSFHDEVRLYQQHVWRCNGPCQNRAPFFGIVRRATNVTPGPVYRWWAQHEATCGGKFIKCQEPENYRKKEDKSQTVSGIKDIRTFFPVNGAAVASSSGSSPAAGASLLSTTKPMGFPAQPRIVGLSDLNNSANVSSVKNFETNVQGVTKQTKTAAVNNVVGFKDLQNRGQKQGSGIVPFGGGKGHTLGEKGVALDGKVNTLEGKRNTLGGKGNTLGGKGNILEGRGNALGGRGNALRGRGTARRGKGHTMGGRENALGGNQINPKKGADFPLVNTGNFKRGGGGRGGMLSNRGSGTFVITGKSTKVQDANDVKDVSPQKGSSSNNTEKFSGTGHVLGSDSRSSAALARPSYSQTLPVGIPTSGANKPAFSFIGSSTSNKVDEKVVLKSNDSDVCCPVCNLLVKGDMSIINSHLDECLKRSHDTTDNKSSCSNEKLSDSTDAIIISDDEEDVKDVHQMVDCPVCSTKVEENAIDAHLNVCVGNSFTEDDDMMDVDCNAPKHVNPKCPICQKEVAAVDLDNHLESCAACSVENVSGAFDEGFSDDDEEEDAAIGSPSKRVSDAGELLYPCPCCCSLIEKSQMNDHLDVCLKQYQ